jgi:hypothetical protein
LPFLEEMKKMLRNMRSDFDAMTGAAMSFNMRGSRRLRETIACRIATVPNMSFLSKFHRTGQVLAMVS